MISDLEYMALVREHWDTITFIKDLCLKLSINPDGQHLASALYEAWVEMPTNDQMQLVFTTGEWQIIRQAGEMWRSANG